jgi:hypothetical protein
MQDLVRLRLNLAVAAAFPSERDAARQCAKELEALKTWMHSIPRNALTDLPYAGQLEALAVENNVLEARFLEIINSKSTEGLDLNHPLRRECISLDPSETALPAWERLRLMSFRDSYNDYRFKCLARSLDTVISIPVLPVVPNELTWKEFATALSNHRDAIIIVAAEIKDRYASLSTAP